MLVYTTVVVAVVVWPSNNNKMAAAPAPAPARHHSEMLVVISLLYNKIHIYSDWRGHAYNCPDFILRWLPFSSTGRCQVWYVARWWRFLSQAVQHEVTHHPGAGGVNLAPSSAPPLSLGPTSQACLLTNGRTVGSLSPQRPSNTPPARPFRREHRGTFVSTRRLLFIRTVRRHFNCELFSH